MSEFVVGRTYFVLTLDRFNNAQVEEMRKKQRKIKVRYCGDTSRNGGGLYYFL